MNTIMLNKTLASNLLQATLHDVTYPTANGLTVDVICKGIAFKVRTIDEATGNGFAITVPADYKAETRDHKGFDHLYATIEGVETDITDELLAVIGSLPSSDNVIFNGVVTDVVGSSEPTAVATQSKLRRSLKTIAGAVALLALGTVCVTGITMLNKR